MSTLIKLQKATSLHSVAHLLGFKPSALSYLLYIKEVSTKYYKFNIPKRSGGSREILAPNPDLKCLQKRLSLLLQDCIDEINLEKHITSTISHGFRRGYSIITNAKTHRKKRYVFNIDLQDFFPCINFGRVRGFFIKNNNFRLYPKVATVLAQIICHENCLPQGSPCSPVISNLIAHLLDIRLSSIAHKYDCSYSRYADDITFSSNMPSFPKQIAKKMDDNDNHWMHGDTLGQIVSKQGFSLNTQKTRMQYRDSRQSVTGLIVNNKVNSRSEYWRTARAMAHSLFSNGSFFINKYFKNDNGDVVSEQIEGTLGQLTGILGFIDQVDYYNKRKNTDVGLRDLSSREKLYRRFLIYKNFYSTGLPKILCEGKTDNIYIREAIKQLSSNYPNLIDPKEKKLKVGFFNYSKTADRLCFLSGGASDLKNFICSYPKECNRFKYKIGNHPVIVLIDNDKGSKSIYSTIKQKTKDDNVDGSKSFYSLGKNLYVVAIPKFGDGDTMIEDYFDQGVLDIKLGKKSFSRSKHFDPKSQYGKHVFANEVVRKQSSKINFSRFSAILNRICLVLKDYEGKSDA